MTFTVVDMQGFNLPQFHPKEISFVTGDQHAHYLIIPPLPYDALSNDIRKQINYLELRHHGLRYSSGYVSDTDLNEILRNHLLKEGGMVYVKGHQKKEFLEKRLHALGSTTTVMPSIINAEQLGEDVPKFTKDLPYCLNHFNNNNKMCSLRNAFKLYNWLCSSLPK